MHRLLLFGGAFLEGPGGPLTGRAAQGHRLALLALLAAEHPRPLTRDKLIAYLWPLSDTARGRRLLRQSLYLLRAELRPEVVLSGGDELLLSPEQLQCDLWEFHRALADADLETAVTVYSGPFLDGVFVDDADEFERWAEIERSRLALRYAEALEALADRDEAAGEIGAAAAWWRRLAEHDPFNSRYALRLMQALEATGDRAGAMRHAANHAALLQAEFGAEPDPDIEALAGRLREEPNPRPVEGAAGAQPTAPGRPPNTAEVEERGERSAVVVATVPTGAAANATTGGPGPFRRRHSARGPATRRRRLQQAVGAALVLGLAGVLASGERGQGVLAALRLSTGAPLFGTGDAAAGEAHLDRSIAVLPFANLSSGEEDEYFSDGITEEIIATLARIGDLRVTSRTSSMRYKHGEKSLPEIARELGVGHILEGSVRRAGDRLRITVQLIDPRSDDHLWAETYDRELSVETLFEIQTDIARQIAAALRAGVSPAERQSAAQPATTILAAYDFYLRGRDAMKPYGRDRHPWAISLFDRALQLDPQFVLAEAYRGETYGTMWSRTRREEYRDSAYASHLRVLRAAPELPEGHRLVGRYHLSFGHLSEALLHVQRALELDPNHAGALYDLARIHSSRGRLDLALPLARRATEIEPTAGIYGWHVFITYVRLGDLEAAERWYRHLLEFVPRPPQDYARLRFVHVHLALLSLMRGEGEQVLRHLDTIRAQAMDEPTVLAFLANTALYAGDIESARRAYERQQDAFPDRWHTVLTGLAFTCWQAGERGRAEALLQEAIERAQERLDGGDETADLHIILAQADAIRGEVDSALGSLETAYARGWRDYHHARLDPRYGSLHSHPRFERLMATARADLDRMRARVRETERP